MCRKLFFPILSFVLSFTAQQISLAAEEPPATNFVYSINSPRDADAQKYIISKSNIEIRDESPVTYWLPSSGGQTFSATTPGVIVYHFPLAEPIVTGTLLAKLNTYHWSYSEGRAFLFVSPDGNNWINAAELEAPEFGKAMGNSTVTLPSIFTGQKDIYVKIELYSYGSSASQGPPWTNTAQHLRYDHNHDKTTFKLDVQLSATKAMDVPDSNRLFNYPPRALPVASVDPETAFPMGLGSAVEQGDQLDLMVDVTGFKGLVDFYLGFSAPAINPGEIYVFNESGAIQGMSVSGLVPWKRNIMEPVSATPIADLPTAMLPPGTYTFYFGVSPAGGLDNLWLWSTEFNHTLQIKGITINTSGNPVLTAVDENDVYYSFFGINDNNGVLDHFNRLVLDKLDSIGNFSNYMTIDFDESGRPVSLITPDAGGSITAEYISETQMKITVRADSGSTEEITMENPYIPSDVHLLTKIGHEQSGVKALTADNEWMFIGHIKTCRDGKRPTVNIRRKVDKAVLEAVPQLVLIKPKVSKINNDPDGDYVYTYTLFGLPDYDEWKRSCLWSWMGGKILSTGGKVIGLFSGIGEKVSKHASQAYLLYSALRKDWETGTIKNTSLNIIENTVDVFGPIISYMSKIYDTSKLPVDACNGPCSRKVWYYLNQILTADEVVTCRLNGVEMEKDFRPHPDFSGSLISVDAPNFDFSETCSGTECSCPNPCAKTVCIDTSCPVPDGAELKEYSGSTTYSRDYTLNGRYVGPYSSWNRKADGSLHIGIKWCRNIKGQLNGWMVLYHDNGSMDRATHWVNDRRNGHRYYFYEDGSLAVDEMMQNDVVTHVEEWLEDGTPNPY